MLLAQLFLMEVKFLQWLVFSPSKSYSNDVELVDDEHLEVLDQVSVLTGQSDPELTVDA